MMLYREEENKDMQTIQFSQNEVFS